MTDAIEMDELNRRRPPVHPDLATGAERNQQLFDDDTKDGTLSAWSWVAASMFVAILRIAPTLHSYVHL